MAKLIYHGLHILWDPSAVAVSILGTIYRADLFW